MLILSTYAAVWGCFGPFSHTPGAKTGGDRPGGTRGERKGLLTHLRSACTMFMKSSCRPSQPSSFDNNVHTVCKNGGEGLNNF